MSQVVEIQTDFVKLAREHRGEWVAIHPETREVIATGASAIEVLEIANAMGVDEPLIVNVIDDYGSLVPCLRA